MLLEMSWLYWIVMHLLFHYWLRPIIKTILWDGPLEVIYGSWEYVTRFSRRAEKLS